MKYNIVFIKCINFGLRFDFPLIRFMNYFFLIFMEFHSFFGIAFKLISMRFKKNWTRFFDCLFRATTFGIFVMQLNIIPPNFKLFSPLLRYTT